ncbi:MULTISPECIES: hypothetical protein [unclassified Rummeliibacillus]|uniref:hypothetical protein n=1 Tax=unclassified Rummeliibacillus TaxID=2622809 RepID=UPI0013DDF848|nr:MULTISPECIES: hypothetical protein [unclassified Rummeliibacillus]
MDDFLTTFAFIPILFVLLYFAAIIFVFYFMVKVLLNQKEIKSFLKDISDKLDQNG